MWAEMPMFLIFSSSRMPGVPVEAFRRNGVVAVRQGRKEEGEKEGTRGEEERRREDIRVRAGPPTILDLQQSQAPLITLQAGLDKL